MTVKLLTEHHLELVSHMVYLDQILLTHFLYIYILATGMQNSCIARPAGVTMIPL